MKLIVFTDGASRGNPGPASYGFTISKESGQLIYQEGKHIGVTTNNVAEYTAVLKSLQYLKEKFDSDLEVIFYMDSKLVVEQLSGRFKIKSEHLKGIIYKINQLARLFGKVSYNHVPRELNKQADKMANIALDNLL